jgi:hypothetical protein
MPIDHSGVGYRRITGLYAALLEQQRAAVVSIDLRALDWTLEDPAAAAVDRAALEEWTKANPQPSALLERLGAGQPAVVDLSMLHGRLPADAPPWLLEGRGCVRVYADDVVEPADGPAEQCAYRRG